MLKNYFLWLFKFVTVLLFLFVILPVVIAGIGAAVGTGTVTHDASNKIAVVELEGPIFDSKEILENLHKQASNSSVDGIVLRIDSPGGAVGPSQEIYAAVSKLKEKKPIVASMGSVAASGGLYSALGASKIYAQPGTLTGSIGVILEIPNIQGIADKVGFNMNIIKSGELKDVGNMFREMKDNEKLYLEKVASQTHADFIEAVVKGRGINEAKVREFADGRVIIGKEAKDLGLIDELGDVYDAAREVYVILGKPLPADKDPKLFYPQDKFGDFKQILQGVKAFAKTAQLVPSLKYQLQ